MKLGTIIILILAVTQIASGAYTYTYGPGTNFGALSLEDTQSILVNGGGGDQLTLFEFSIARIESTSTLQYLVGGIWEINAAGYSHLTITGGEIKEARIGSYGRLTMSGGRVDILKSSLYGSVPALPEEHKIQFICQSRDYNSTTKLLTGVWEDDSLFSIQLVNTTGYTATIDNIYFTIVPEPLSLALLGLGGLLVRRYARR